MNKIFKLLGKILIRLISNFNIKKKFINSLNFNIGLNSLLQNRNLYDNGKNINEFELKINSQNGEDGIIDFLLHKLKISKPNFVEIGVGEYVESNTRFLYDRYLQRGLIIDCIENFKKRASSNINLWKGDLNIVEEKINPENVNQVLGENCNFDIDLFSIDIDGIDYWVIEKLNPKISKLFIAEYNSVFGHEYDISVPYIDNFERYSYHYSGLCYGMSLKALIRLMNEKGFYFIGTNNFKNNAFFINNNFQFDVFFKGFQAVNNLNLETFTNSTFAESRNKKGKLNYLRGKKRWEEIKDCEIVDFSDNGKIKKIKDI
tara:strand:- start:147 stop:1097 length:951 start_codon:yes stop_codon:yes gene_type:complete